METLLLRTERENQRAQLYLPLHEFVTRTKCSNTPLFGRHSGLVRSCTGSEALNSKVVNRGGCCGSIVRYKCITLQNVVNILTNFVVETAPIGNWSACGEKEVIKQTNRIRNCPNCVHLSECRRI